MQQSLVFPASKVFAPVVGAKTLQKIIFLPFPNLGRPLSLRTLLAKAGGWGGLD
jgi:hypothetical protein